MRIFPKPGTLWPKARAIVPERMPGSCSQVQADVRQTGPTPCGIPITCVDPGQIWPTPARFTPGSSRLGPIWGRRPNSETSGAEANRFGPMSVELDRRWADFGNRRPHLARHRPSLVR